MADEYVNPLYFGLLQAYGIDDDTKPTLNKDVLKAWTDVFEANAQYRIKRDAGQLKRETDDIKARLGYIKSSRDLQAKLEETKGRDRRETVKAYVDRVNALTKARTDLAVQRSQFSDTVFAEARAAFEGPEGNAAKSAEALFKTLTDRQMKWSEGNPDTAGLATQWARMVLNQPDIQSVDPEAAAQAIRNAKGSDELAMKTKRFIRAAQQADSMERSATAKLASEEERAARLSAMSEMELAGLSEQSIEDIVQGSASAQLAFETLLAETPEQMQERMNAIAEADSQYAAMVAREKQLASYVFGEGNEGAFTRTGRIIANPEFQAWAQDNGYNIGRAQVNADGELEFYTPGNADMRAIAAFNRQVKTGQPPRMFGARNSGQLVRVTVTDPAARERVLQFNNLGGGRYAVKDGAVLTPQQYAEMGIAPSGVEVAQVGDEVYVKSEGRTYKYNNGVLESAAAPASAKFAAGVVYDDDGKPTRYMTTDDIFQVPSSFGGVSEGEDAAINRAAGVEIVGADQLPAIGEMQVVGYRDRLNARDMTQYGEGAFSINGGQYVFGRGAKVEVLETRGREPAANALARRAERRVERAGLTGLPVEAVRRAEPGQTYAQPGGVFPPAPATGAAAPVTAEADFLKPAAADIQVEEGALGPAAPTAAAKAPEVSYFKGSDGAVYRSTEGVGIQQIAPRRGSVTIDPRVIAEETPEFSALTGRLFADGEPLSAEEGRKVEMRDVGAQARVAAPETQVREIRGSTFMGPGRVRNLGTDIEDTLARVGGRRKTSEPAAPSADEAETRLLPPRIDEAEDDVPVQRDAEAPSSFDVARSRGRDEALMGVVSRSKQGGRDYDLAQEYAKIQGLKQSDPQKYAAEVGRLADTARLRMREAPPAPPVGMMTEGEPDMYTERAPSAPEAKRAPTPAQAPATAAPVKKQSVFAAAAEALRKRRTSAKPPVSSLQVDETVPDQRPAPTAPTGGRTEFSEAQGIADLRRAIDTQQSQAYADFFRRMKDADKYGEAPPKSPTVVTEEDFGLPPRTPPNSTQAATPAKSKSDLSAFRRVMPKRKLPPTTEETEIV